MAELILRPSGNYSNQLSRNTGSNNYECVDETVNDGDTTYVYVSGLLNYVDLYETSGYTSQTGTINSVTIYNSAKDNGTHNSDILRTQIRSGTTTTQGAWGDYLTTSYVDYSDEYTTNPTTFEAWTWDEIGALIIGTRLRGYDASSELRCTQVWAVVNYTEESTVVSPFPSFKRVGAEPADPGDGDPFDPL